MASKPFSSGLSILLVIIVLTFAQSTVAQNGRRSSDDASSWEIGFSGGLSRFLTSINPNSDAIYKKFNYWNADFNAGITISVVKIISPKFSAGFELMTTKLSGSWNVNNGYPIPPLAIALGLPYPNPFKTGVNVANLFVLANLNKIVAPNRANDKWFLFAKGGFGLAFLKEYSGLYPLGQPGNLYKYTYVLGGGISYTVNEKVKLKLGTSWYRVETDRLDGVHTLKPGGNYENNTGFAFNIKERYIYPYIEVTYGLGKANFKAHFFQKSRTRSIWTKHAKKRKKYKRRR
jgi:hypothetical protein